MRIKEGRQSNFELLRAVSMAIIILSHYSVHGGLLAQELSANQILAQLFKIGGKLGVTCFVLISAYFLVDAKFKFKNVLRISGEVVLYSLLSLGLVYYSSGAMTSTEIIKSIFSPIYGIYWFPTAYIGLYLCFPVLNVIISAVEDKLNAGSCRRSIS